MLNLSMVLICYYFYAFFFLFIVVTRLLFIVTCTMKEETGFLSTKNTCNPTKLYTRLHTYKLRKNIIKFVQAVCALHFIKYFYRKIGCLDNYKQSN